MSRYKNRRRSGGQTRTFDSRCRLGYAAWLLFVVAALVACSEQTTPPSGVDPTLAAQRRPPGLTAVPGGLNLPMNLALDPKGQLYVADATGVHLVNNEGKIVRTIVSVGPETIRLPGGFALDGSGGLYVTDQTGNQVKHFDAQGQVLATLGKPGTGPGEFDHPSDVALDAQGNLWVVDQGNVRIQKFDPTGKPVFTFGSVGGDDTQFFRPRSVKLDKDGNLWVTDLGDFFVKQFTPDGQFLKRIGNLHYGEKLTLIRTVVIDPAGLVYLLDGFNHRIQKFDSTGKLLNEFGKIGSGPDEFRDPEDMVMDANGNLIIADKQNNRVVKLTPPK